MRNRYLYRPEALGCLEQRLAMSHASKAISVATVALQGPVEGFVASKVPSVETLVNQSFAHFVADYSQSRAIYLSAVQAHTASASDATALGQYTTQRVTLLGQQILNNFQATSNTRHKHGITDPSTIITRKIDGPASMPNATIPFNNGTLGKALLQATPAPNSSPTAVALDSLAQDNAIESARVAVINGLNTARAQAAEHH